MRKEFVKEMKKMKEFLIRQDEEMKKMTNIGFQIDAPIFESLYEVNDFCIRLISDKYGIDNDSIFWFIHDNNFGEEKLDIAINGKHYVIDSIEKFYDVEKLIEPNSIKNKDYYI